MIYLKNTITNIINAFEESSNLGQCHTLWVKATDDEIKEYLFNEAKNDKQHEIKEARIKYASQPITINENTYKAGNEAILKFKALFNDENTIYPLKYLLEDDITWVYLSEQDAKFLSQKFTDQETASDEKQSIFLKKLKIATTIDDINNIIVDF